MNRYLFLDIDGVVNTVMIYNRPIEGRNLIHRDHFYFELNHPGDKRVSNEFAIRWLSKLCLEYDLKIVITSTWLIGHSLEDIKECLYNSGLDKGIDIIDGCFNNMFKSRGTQIESWFNANKINPDKSIFIILDDDVDMCGFNRDYTEYLIHCHNQVGFGMPEYTKACTLLDKLTEER